MNFSPKHDLVLKPTIFKFLSAISVILVVASCQTSSPQGSDRIASDDRQYMNLSVAASYLDAGRPDKAMHELASVLSEKPNNIEALNLMGLSQLALSNPKKAVIYLERAWKIEKSAPIAVNLSSAYLEVKKHSDAEKIINFVLNAKTEKPYRHQERLYHNLGLVADRTKRPLLAEKMFKKAVEENPMFYMSHLQLSKLYLERRKTDLAKKQLESARFACPSCYEPLKELVDIHISRGEFTSARQLIGDYKLTEGISTSDRRKVNNLESKLSRTATR